jgi:hypothetical protein
VNTNDLDSDDKTIYKETNIYSTFQIPYFSLKYPLALFLPVLYSQQVVVPLETEPLEIIIFVSRHNMSYTRGRHSDKLSSISVDLSSIATLGSVRLVTSEGNTMESRPLLDLLQEVLIDNQVVSSTVPGLELGVRTAVARVHSLDLVGPLLSRLDDLSVGANTVRANWAGSRGSGHASGSNARVACGSGETVGVRRDENVGHHASGAGSSNKDLVAVGVVSLNNIVDHADQDLAVTLAVMLERLGTGDIPAVEILGGRGEDENRTARVGEGPVLGLLEIARSATTTWVQGKNDSRVRREVVGDVGLHLQLGAVRRSKVGDSLELSSN